ncbi:hypothetical protein S40285_09114 [Stachybotrys chlorohalonatus IBT 40285]|uniref:DDHD domain-containing protein n=1 Tax=Stachybotrys chlorohalonatus (strain IBT 40285) TaxID=1283841 RepID=A0A084Q7X0_STAC4|nr:hypothetical protein S40285_09114 [Stachybotrys chlorohalonata IBT 40285]
MASGESTSKQEKSFLTSAVETINPWGSTDRTETPTPHAKKDGSDTSRTSSAAPASGDHNVTHLYGQSLRSYPADCPPLNVAWFHAVDVPKRKPKLLNRSSEATSPPKAQAQPKKFSAFSSSDSSAIEASYQRLLEATEANPGSDENDAQAIRNGDQGGLSNTSLERDHSKSSGKNCTRVPVNEDFLFDVDIEQRELAPVYWLGPIYEVRRGTWFFQEGSSLRPCEENLAAQLEEGYLKIRPWLNRGKSTLTPKTSHESLKSKTTPASPMAPQSHRLFGTYMNSVATYQDASTAWLSSDSMLSWVTSSVYERFAGGGYLSGMKLIRGYAEPSKAKDKEEGSISKLGGFTEVDERQQKALKRRSAPPSTKSSTHEQTYKQTPSSRMDSRQALHRQLSSLIEGEGKSKGETEEEVRRREEQEIQEDYNARAGETQGREIAHLVLVTHGIGQLMGLRAENVNFVHDVNTLRKTLKSVYSQSEDLKALNAELAEGPGNCQVQVLPVCWRHLLDFPKQRGKKSEHDLGDADTDEVDYPSLEDITIEGVAFARSLISDLALDVLLYQSAYREEITMIVLSECNRIVRLFRERNPDFKGKIHIMGHSLGSAIFFDIACRQREERTTDSHNRLRVWPSHGNRKVTSTPREPMFEFEIEHFYCLGSPVGLFQMVKGRTIAARHSPHALPSESPLNPDITDDPFLSVPLARGKEGISSITNLPMSVSSPKVAQLYNIFHPSDPISYRLEPLISPAMASLKPQVLPYTKKGYFSNVAPQGLTGIGYAVGQSMSSLWSNLSAGLASNLLNRGVGLSNEEVARMTVDATTSPPAERSPGAGTNITAGGVISDTSKLEERTNQRKRRLADSSTSRMPESTSGNDPTLIDDELETLFSKFQKKRTELSQGPLSDKSAEDDGNASKLRLEENKVRALNRNGRVDYSIQESVLDFNPINTIASHLGYWADEDVNHFVLSQLLSNKSKFSRNETR